MVLLACNRQLTTSRWVEILEVGADHIQEVSEVVVARVVEAGHAAGAALTVARAHPTWMVAGYMSLILIAELTSVTSRICLESMDN